MSLFFLEHADLVICPNLTLYMTDQKYTALFLRLLITADKPAAAFQKMFLTNKAFKNICKFIAPEYKNKNASSAWFLNLEASVVHA